MKIQDRFVEKIDNTLASVDELLQSMQEYIIKESIRDELLKWEGLLLHLENEYLLQKDEFDIEIAAAAFAYAMEHPCQEESEYEVIECVGAIRKRILAKAEELGIGTEITPKTLILALKTGKLSQLEDYIYEQTG